MSLTPENPTKDHIEACKRRREWVLILLILVLVVFFSRLEPQLFDLTSKIPLSNNVLVLALINLNILLIILFLFLVFRNLFKLFLERRRDVPGARLRTNWWWPSLPCR